jgi:hypothetical protein
MNISMSHIALKYGRKWTDAAASLHQQQTPKSGNINTQTGTEVQKHKTPTET